MDLLELMRLHVPEIATYQRVGKTLSIGFRADGTSLALFCEHDDGVEWFHQGWCQWLLAGIDPATQIRYLRTLSLRPQQAYVGIGSRWGNPYSVGCARDRREVIARYRRWLWRHVEAGVSDLTDLRWLDRRELVSAPGADTTHHEVLRAASRWARTVAG